MTDIKSLYYTETEQLIVNAGFPSFRAKQINQWLLKNVSDFNQMLNIPAELRLFLSSNCRILGTGIEKKLVSMYDNTVKYLFSLHDGNNVESVVMSYHHGNTICISTQVGCKMGCTFCATGKDGFIRNLSAGEMLSQVQSAERDLNIRISNIVLMGMGEPLDNFENVIRFIKLVTGKDSLNIGVRHISLSTCGLVNKIYDLAELKLGITLSVSLHAPNDLIRSKTMPVNNKYPVDELIKACKYYTKQTRRRISFEYALIDGLNDSVENAKELALKLKGMLCHVNLIPVNNVTGTGYKKPDITKLKKFASILENNKINTTVRRTLGSDINASCGQLRQNSK